MSNPDPFASPPQRPPLGPYEGGPRAIATRWGKAIQFGLVMISLIVAVRLASVFYVDPSRNDPPRTKDGAVVPANTPSVDQFGPPWVAQEAKVARAHELEAAKLLQHEFLQHADELTKHLADWRRELDLWAAEIDPLLKNVAGKALAANADAFARFRAIYQTERPGPDRLNWIRDEMQPRTDSVRGASEDPESALRPDTELSQRLIGFAAEARQAAEGWRTARAQIKTLVEHAGSPVDAGGRSLEAALAEQQASDRLAAAETIRVATEQAQRDAVAQEAAARAEAIRIAGDVKARKIVAEAEAGRTAQQIAEDRQRHQVELDRRKAALAKDMPDVKRYLAPFIVKGYAQPNGYFCRPNRHLRPDVLFQNRRRGRAQRKPRRDAALGQLRHPRQRPRPRRLPHLRRQRVSVGRFE